MFAGLGVMFSISAPGPFPPLRFLFLRRDPVFRVPLLLGCRRRQRLRRIYRFRLRLATDMRDKASGVTGAKECRGG